LIELIDQLTEQQAKETTVTFKRKNLLDSDDEDEDLENMF